MARLYNTFEFVGKVGFGKEPTVEQEVGKNGWKKKRQSFIVKETDNNGAFVVLEGLFHPEKDNKVYTFSKGMFGEKGASITVDWKDRKKDSIVDTVADFKKIIIDLTPPDVDKQKLYDLQREKFNLESKENATDEDKKKLLGVYNSIREEFPERHEFLHILDAIEFLQDKFEGLKNKKVRVKGDVVKSGYGGKFYTTYVPKTIELVSDEEVNKLSLFLDVFFKKDAVDEKSFKKEQRIFIDTYVIGYDSQAKKDQFFPQKLVIDATKFDMENEKHVGFLNALKKQFNGVKSKEVNHIAIEAKVIRGNNEVEFDESMLTKEQKELIEYGLATLDDFKPKSGTVNGDSIDEIRLVKPLLKEFDDVNNFKAGAKVSTFTPEQLVFVDSSPTPPQEETKPPKSNEEDELGDAFEDEDDDLLGLL